MRSSQRLHLGCGELVGSHWHNVDSSPNVLLDNRRWLRTLFRPILPASSRKMKFQGVQYFDLRRDWPYPEGAFDVIYSSHFFEHLSFQDGQHVLKECFRSLRSGGTIRFLIPSIESEIARYLKFKNTGDPLAATAFARAVNTFPEAPKGSWWYRLFFSLYDKNSHKMFYDAESLAYYFAQVGFKETRVAGYLDSSIPYLEEVEKPDRFNNAVCIEAVRPLLAVAA